MHCVYVLMWLIYSLRCPFPSISIQRFSWLELWPWRRVECVKGRLLNVQVRRRDEMRREKGDKRSGYLTTDGWSRGHVWRRRR